MTRFLRAQSQPGHHDSSHHHCSHRSRLLQRRSCTGFPATILSYTLVPDARPLRFCLRFVHHFRRSLGSPARSSFAFNWFRMSHVAVNHFARYALDVNRDELTRLLARDSDLPPAEAADQLDRAVHAILKKLRQGRTARLPGIGKFTPGAPPSFQFSTGTKRKGGRRGRK